MKASKKIVLKGLRASYPHLFSKDSMSDKYTCDFLIAKNNPQLADLKQAVLDVAADCKKQNPGKNVKTAVIHDGDLEKPNEANFAGSYFIKTKTSSAAIKESVFKRLPSGAIEKITDESEFYGGCNCSASLVVSWYEFNGTFGVNLLLNGVCREEGGDAFGSNGCSASDFIEDDDLPEDFS